MSVIIETTLGDITVDLFTKQRPLATLNFLKLCKLKYYNYHLFHTVNSKFVAQTGDPTGSGDGGSSVFGVVEGPDHKFFPIEKTPKIKHNRLGLLSFVGNEKAMIASQFFITLSDNLAFLDGKHCVFGKVVEGLDVLDLLNEAICDTKFRPYVDIRITHTVVLADPFEDIKGLVAPSRSPSPTAERLQGGRIAPDENIDDTAGKDMDEITEMTAEREARARATILEMVGDIPKADVAPPENVLFVCKLNPATTDEDLDIIFGRFGKIVSSEVIRDRKTKESMQYAFIEFDSPKACAEAYLKMDNVLIDDRRIHVDFSQSVAKYRWMGKGRLVRSLDDHGKKMSRKADADLGKGIYQRNDKRDREHTFKKREPSKHERLSPERRKHSHVKKMDQEHRDSGSERLEHRGSRVHHQHQSSSNGNRASPQRKSSENVRRQRDSHQRDHPDMQRSKKSPLQYRKHALIDNSEISENRGSRVESEKRSSRSGRGVPRERESPERGRRVDPLRQIEDRDRVSPLRRNYQDFPKQNRHASPPRHRSPQRDSSTLQYRHKSSRTSSDANRAPADDRSRSSKRNKREDSRERADVIKRGRHQSRSPRKAVNSPRRDYQQDYTHDRSVSPSRNRRPLIPERRRKSSERSIDARYDRVEKHRHRSRSISNSTRNRREISAERYAVTRPKRISPEKVRRDVPRQRERERSRSPGRVHSARNYKRK